MTLVSCATAPSRPETDERRAVSSLAMVVVVATSWSSLVVVDDMVCWVGRMRTGDAVMFGGLRINRSNTTSNA